MQYGLMAMAETAIRNCEIYFLIMMQFSAIYTLHYTIHSPCRDGMVKRPGNESYLMKVVEEERKAYSQGLEVFSPSEEGEESEGGGDITGSESAEED